MNDKTAKNKREVLQAGGLLLACRSENEYDELGRLKTTTPHDLPNFKSAYAYTVRSWISQIANSPYIENLTYKYNGNVATMQWIQGGATRKYAFAYDGLSRLTMANYNNSGAEQFSAYYGYDKHGNIAGLSRPARRRQSLRRAKIKAPALPKGKISVKLIIN
jgi:hypothetical protein